MLHSVLKEGASMSSSICALPKMENVYYHTTLQWQGKDFPKTIGSISKK